MCVLEAGRGQKNSAGRERQTIKDQHANLFLNLKMSGYGCDMPQSVRLDGSPHLFASVLLPTWATVGFYL